MTTLLLIEDDDMLADSLTGLLDLADVPVIRVETFAAAERALSDDTHLRITHVLSDWDLGMREPLDGGQIVTKLEATFGDAEYAIWSGLERDAPDFAQFFLKDNISAPLQWLGVQ